ncbi:hypothetical protein FBALC1_01127 [Flavobacteriales bacterium ALC-1]|nr:hypothetical protein FBALC1_01127 [Flavobacteriales bacterium ALC-1]
MKHLVVFLILVIGTLSYSCVEKKQHQGIRLKWNKAFSEDTFDRSVTGLKWALSYLGSTVTSDPYLEGITLKDSIILLNAFELGLSKKSAKNLSKLHEVFRNSEEYKKNNAFDLGRYIALTFGNSHHYYAIVDVPEKLDQIEALYTFDTIKGYIDNSSVSKVHRVISFSELSKSNNQGFISTEVDSISKDILEFETLQRMANGQLKFAVYDVDGTLKEAANNNVTRAGKPSKCIWCHETKILPVFKPQQNYLGYLKITPFNDSLKYFNRNLQNYQNTTWTDKNLLDKTLHEELELLYISFMEPNIERISKEWNISLADVKQKLAHLKTHQHHEFPFLGNLYHRKDIDALAPIKYLEVPESIREASNNEINLLH